MENHWKFLKFISNFQERTWQNVFFTKEIISTIFFRGIVSVWSGGWRQWNGVDFDESAGRFPNGKRQVSVQSEQGENRGNAARNQGTTRSVALLFVTTFIELLIDLKCVILINLMRSSPCNIPLHIFECKAIFPHNGQKPRQFRPFALSRKDLPKNASKGNCLTTFFLYLVKN